MKYLLTLLVLPSLIAIGCTDNSVDSTADTTQISDPTPTDLTDPCDPTTTDSTDPSDTDVTDPDPTDPDPADPTDTDPTETGCIWSPEVCNGLDDDCDGAIDEAGCSDGSACTIGDACVDGVCISGTPLACDDGFACNGVEVCDPEFGCYGVDVPPATDGLDCPVGVVVGAGSYATAPPAHEGDGPADMLTWEVYVTPEVAAADKPLPTNQWWTDALVNPFAGDLWAFPLVVDPGPSGLDIAFPTTWNNQGSAMVTDPRLEVRANPKNDSSPADVIVADFEATDFGEWVVTGSAFGSGPVAGTLPGQSQMGGWIGDGHINGFHGGDSPTGTLTSPAIDLTAAWVHMLVSGGNHPPDDQGGATCIEIWPAGEVGMGTPLWWATGSNTEWFSWRSWEVPAELVGTSVQIRALDEHSGGWGHINLDHIVLSAKSDPNSMGGFGFTALDARVSGWGDWNVALRLEDESNRSMDFSLARGVPFVWVELAELTPMLGSSEGVEVLSSDGSPLMLPATTDRVVLVLDGKHFGVYAAEGSEFILDDTGYIGIESPSDAEWIVLAALPSADALDEFAPYAWNKVSDTRFDWDLDTPGGKVDTTWKIDTQPLRGSTLATLQGWLPHHTEGTDHTLGSSSLFGTIDTYPTPRGALKLAEGTEFSVSWPFRGLIPGLPEPKEPPVGVNNPYDPERATGHIEQYATTTGYGGDTYWGGKDLSRYARYLWMALETDHHESRDALSASLETALTDWLTYTDGETEHYYAAYDTWGALIGFNESYWSYQFTDNHFHLGYLTAAAAMLGTSNPEFLDDYGPMATMVARQYANWDRDHALLPRLRTFDVWEGHSWAGGLSSGGGNNQESSSEAIQAWGGLYLLGSMLGDEKMRATGAMGWAIESTAMREYWMDVRDENFPDEYNHDVVGILFAWGPAFATYFSGDPAWIFGIQWLPISPLLEHLLIDEGVAEAQYTAMMAEREAWLDGATNSISSMGTSLGNVVLGFQQLFDPDGAAAELDALWDSGDAVVHDAYTGGISYWQAHARRTLGRRIFNAWTDEPLSAVYEQDDGTRTIVVYNPDPIGRIVSVFDENGDVTGRLAALPGTTTSSQLLSAEPSGPTTIVQTRPVDGETEAPRLMRHIDVVFDRDVDPALVSAATLSGPGLSEPGITVYNVSGPWAEYEVNGFLLPNETYTLTVPTEPTFTIITFTLEPQPPLELISSSPSHTETGVELDVSHLELTFNARVDPATLGDATLEGPEGTQVLELSPTAALGDTSVRLPLPTLVEGSVYTARIGPGLTDTIGNTLADETVITFSAAPVAFPPALYSEAFAGSSMQIPSGVIVNTGVLDPHTGSFSMTVSNPTTGASVTTGDGPSVQLYVDPPVDLSAYSTLSYWIKTTGQTRSWNASGDSDEGPTMVWKDGLGPDWTRVELALPANRSEMSRIFVFSVSPGQTLTLDDIELNP